jgi:hypothetical protein
MNRDKAIAVIDLDGRGGRVNLDKQRGRGHGRVGFSISDGFQEMSMGLRIAITYTLGILVGLVVSVKAVLSRMALSSERAGLRKRWLAAP